MWQRMNERRLNRSSSWLYGGRGSLVHFYHPVQIVRVPRLKAGTIGIISPTFDSFSLVHSLGPAKSSTKTYFTLLSCKVCIPKRGA